MTSYAQPNAPYPLLPEGSGGGRQTTGFIPAMTVAMMNMPGGPDLSVFQW